MNGANHASSFAGRQDQANHPVHHPLHHQLPPSLLLLLPLLPALLLRGVWFRAVGRRTLQMTVCVVYVANIVLNKVAVPPRHTRVPRACLSQLCPFLLILQLPCHHYFQLIQLPYCPTQHPPYSSNQQSTSQCTTRSTLCLSPPTNICQVSGKRTNPRVSQGQA